MEIIKQEIINSQFSIIWSMPYEVKIKERKARVEILEQNDTWYKVKIGDRIYDLDVARVENGVYSVIYNGKSTNMEMIEGDAPNKYIVNTRSSDYEIEILDAKARYAAAHKGELDNADTIISSPMPGKVVRIPVKKRNESGQGRHGYCGFGHENGKRIQKPGGWRGEKGFRERRCHHQRPPTAGRNRKEWWIINGELWMMNCEL